MDPSGDPTEPRLDLRLVEDSDELEVVQPVAEVSPPVSEPLGVRTSESTPAAPTSYLTWGLLGATLLFAWLGLVQVEKANGLAADLAGVEGELVSAQADLVAWEEHGASVQSGVQGIATQLGALQQLLLAAPTSEAGVAPGSNSEAGIEQNAAPAQ